MHERDWVEKLFIKSVKKAVPDFDSSIDFSDKLHEIFESSLPSITKTFEKHLKQHSRKQLKQKKKEISHFTKNINRTWKSAFDLLDIFISFNLDYGIMVSDSFRENNQEDIKFETLLRLHARSCQISSEILQLIKGGFADGALARWRSLHEISVIATFLEQGTEELCQRYLDYYFIENHYEKLEYQKNCEKLGYEPLSNEDIEDSIKLVEIQKKKYGNNYSKQYGWVGDSLPKNKWNFAGIEETVDFKFMRSFYKMANNSVHSGAKGFIYKLGLINNDEIMHAGPSNYGFADPAQNTAYSLFQTTLTLSEFEPYLEDLLFIKAGANMLDELSAEFISIQKEIEIQDENL